MGSNGKNLIKNGSLTKWSRVILRPYWYSEHGQCEPTPLLVWLYPLRGVLWDSTLFGLRLKTFVDPFRKHDLFIVFTTPVQTRPIVQCYSRLCISGCVSGWLSVCMQVCMSACLHVCMDGWMDEWMYACLHGWMDGCMHVCMDGWMDVCYVCYVCIPFSRGSGLRTATRPLA